MKSFTDAGGKTAEALAGKLLNFLAGRADGEVGGHVQSAKAVADARGIWAGLETLEALLAKSYAGEQVGLNTKSNYTFKVVKGHHHIGFRITREDSALQVRYNSKTGKAFVSGEKGELGEFVEVELANLGILSFD